MISLLPALVLRGQLWTEEAAHLEVELESMFKASCGGNMEVTFEQMKNIVHQVWKKYSCVAPEQTPS